MASWKVKSWIFKPFIKKVFASLFFFLKKSLHPPNFFEKKVLFALFFGDFGLLSFQIEQTPNLCIGMLHNAKNTAGKILK